MPSSFKLENPYIPTYLEVKGNAFFLLTQFMKDFRRKGH